ncbi:MAG TPA: 50S ribosomal protein L21 [bacterium]|nr:50S ribosomal protein L21 [bacterium]HPJ72697.1 50S ribosomal protein L21 [bacterium]HPQ66244.1 50S ribosomal protein L21 [bacterium]
MKCAVVEVAGRQFLIREGETINAPRLGAAAGDEVVFDRVLLFWDGEEIQVGRPYLEGFSVGGTISEEARGPKLVVFKFKRRKGYRRKRGHRQDIHRVQVTGIAAPGESSPAAEPAAAPAEAGE